MGADGGRLGGYEILNPRFTGSIATPQRWKAAQIALGLEHRPLTSLVFVTIELDSHSTC